MIPVFYSPKMVANSECFSPSAAKPEKVVASWQSQFPIELIEPQPVTIEEISRAHDRAWAERVLAGQSDNGFSNRSLEVASTLPYTNGSMLSAARHALKTGKVAAAPCSGFHHAEHARPMGYCTFNGLMITALALRAEGVKKMGILDLDMHYGNGTDNILTKVGNGDYWCKHFTAGYEIERADQVEYFFNAWLPDALACLVNCEIVLFQAGADPHVLDPYGGWLETEELRKRDAMVFDALSASKVPVAWNLAGGYQVKADGSIPAVLEIHDNTMRECVRVYG
jgi:acetoin utilization deacetylase AcuC-like enzyme